MRNAKTPKWASLDPDRRLPKSVKVPFRVSRVLMEKIRKSSLSKTYPDPKDKNQDCNFESVQDYLLYCISRVEKMGQTKWVIFTYT